MGVVPPASTGGGTVVTDRVRGQPTVNRHNSVMNKNRMISSFSSRHPTPRVDLIVLRAVDDEPFVCAGVSRADILGILLHGLRLPHGVASRQYRHRLRREITTERLTVQIRVEPAVQQALRELLM